MNNGAVKLQKTTEGFNDRDGFSNIHISFLICHISISNVNYQSPICSISRDINQHRMLYLASLTVKAGVVYNVVCQVYLSTLLFLP